MTPEVQRLIDYWSAFTWAYFADWRDYAVALFAILLIVLMIVWWRQQTRHWLRIAEGSFLAALILNIVTTFLFQVPPHQAGCDGVCPGRSGYPHPVILLTIDGQRLVAPLDFLVNLLFLWLFILGGLVLWTIGANLLQWWRRSRRWRVAFVVLFLLLPWALLPRILNPPQPLTAGEELRLTNNARRSAEFTYRVTGFWVLRLALEDIRYLEADEFLSGSEGGTLLAGQGTTEVCLRGYTYFYVPWQRYRITLDASGATALQLEERPLRGSCWAE